MPTEHETTLPASGIMKLTEVLSLSPTLTEKIDRLPLEKQVEVEKFVDQLAEEPSIAKSDRLPADMKDLLRRIDERRERLRREHGLFDSVPIIRELRELGT